MAISFDKFEDLEKILPEQLKLTGRKLQCVLLGLILVLILTCVILSVSLGLHAGGVMGPCTSGGSSSASYSPLSAQVCTTVECMETSARLMENMDTKVSPCEDFHQYACGGWSRRHTVLPDSGDLTVRKKLQLDNDEKIRDIIEKAILVNTPNSTERKLKQFFKMCLHDYGRMREAGTELLNLMQLHLKGWYGSDPENWQNNGWNLNDAISTIQGELNVDVLLRISVGIDWTSKESMIMMYTGGTGMYYNYYIRPDKEGIQEAYKDYMRQVAGLLIRDANVTLNSSELNRRVEQFVSDAYGQEEHLAQITQEIRTSGISALYRSRVTTIRELENNFTQLPWREMVQKAFDGFQVQDDTRVRVSPFGYLQKVDELLRNETTDKDRIMNNYLVWQLASSYSRYLSWEYKFAGYRYYEMAYGRTEFPATWEECLTFTKQRLGSALAAEFLAKHANLDAKTQVEKMQGRLQMALRDSIERLHWMDNTTKASAVEKVNAMSKSIGFPESYFNQTFLDNLHAKLEVNVTDGFFKTFINVQRFQRHMRTREMQAGSMYYMWLFALSGGSGGSTPAYFWRTNYLIVPPGSMQFPSFQTKNPSFMNYGALGSMMADEMTTSINQMGRYIWTNGSWADWWSRTTVDGYTEAKDCFKDYFDGTIVGPYLINGANETVVVSGQYQAKRALDIVAGVRTAFKAYQDWAAEQGTEQMPVGVKLTPEQAYFLSAAQTQCFVRTDELAYNYASYQYIPENILYNGALSHMPEFAKTFGCKVNTPMVANNTCNVF